MVVVGLGHAGCEAALSCARMGLATIGVTLRKDRIAVMSCNPAIGGTAKGHLVRELDALGPVNPLAQDEYAEALAKALRIQPVVLLWRKM